MTARALVVAVIGALLGALALPASAGERLDLPDVRLIDQAGREVGLREAVGGRVVALQFVFTRCTAVCPALGAQFGRVQELLDGASFGLISISIDPETDTPARLASWARRFGAGPAWTLLTGARDDVARVQKACGVFAADAASHSPTVVVLDGASGRFTRVSGLAPAQAVADAMARLARPEAATSAR